MVRSPVAWRMTGRKPASPSSVQSRMPLTVEQNQTAPFLLSTAHIFSWIFRMVSPGVKGSATFVETVSVPGMKAGGGVPFTAGSGVSLIQCSS